MASARRKGVAKVEIYQDPDDSITDVELARTLQNYNNALQPTQHDITDSNIILGPPAAQGSVSPTKRSSPQSSPQLGIDQSIFDAVTFPPPEGFFPTDSPSKKATYGPYYPSVFQRPQKGFFTTFSSSSLPQKENQRLSISAIPSFNASDPLYTNAQSLSKRPAPELSPAERPLKRAKLQDEFLGPLPAPWDMPSVPDEEGKPNYSYAQLIGMAILRTPERKMTLSQIYKWISNTFSFYRNGQAGSGWQNSIRHNLSLNKAFVKKERPKEDPGKGNYWAIVEGQEGNFVKDRSFRRQPPMDQAYFRAQQSDTCPLPAPLPHAPLPDVPKPSMVADSSTFPAESVSSDATLPMSDQPNDQSEPVVALADVTVPSPDPVTLSSPPLDLNSSPPIPQKFVPDDTPSNIRRASVSRSGEPKQRFDNFRDSGFYSSIESSAPRGQGGSNDPSDPDRRTSGLKRGRAEEAIARMRGSSFDPSPTKSRPVFKKPQLDPTLASSPPLQGSSIGFPPLTPGLKLYPPTKVPPTISPGTHLRRHRESIRDLVATPAVRGIAEFKYSPSSYVLNDAASFSPRFSPLRMTAKNTPSKNILAFDSIETGRLASLDENHTLALNSFTGEDSDENVDLVNFDKFFVNGSPTAKKTPRPTMHRALMSTGALQDVSGSRQNMRLGSPIRFSPPKKVGSRSLSPTKKIELPKNDVFFGAADSSEDEISKEALDLSKGFRTIGATADKENRPTRNVGHDGSKISVKGKTHRPPLGQSSNNLM